MFEELGDIKARTFGILFLQIIRTLRVFLGLLPPGRVILLIIAAVTIALPLIQGKTISLQEVRNAVAQTGLGDFLARVMAELNETVGELADNASLLADAASVSFVQLSGAIEIMARDISQALGNVESLLDLQGSELSSEAIELLNKVGFNLGGALRKADSTGNLSSNLDVFLGPALRSLGDEIRTIPRLAEQLVKL